MTVHTLDLTPSPRILQVIAETDLQVHQCLAELIDNCFDELQKARDAGMTSELRVDIRVPTAREADRNSEVVVADTGRGMSPEQMEHALRAGSTNNSQFGTLGLFGMGFNVATARLGKLTVVKSGRVGDSEWNVASIDISEMQRTGSYQVPLTQEPKNPDEHGTVISVRRLHTDTVAALQGTQEVKKIRANLGRIYTYMLRDPETMVFSGSEVVGGMGLSLYLNGTQVKPALPCIWDPSRSVPLSGTAVPAVQVLDIPLSDAWACMVCGYWSGSRPERCVECGSTDVRERERRIWGWLGIQRYLHSDDFGISLIRQGRVIVARDKGLFAWTAPDGSTEVEYPVELREGRIVGEIHLDHAPVSFRKTDFDRQSPQWTAMVERVRGRSPLRPKKAREAGMPVNDTILGSLFSAYRRSDPGLRYLIPGDGKSALHEQAKVRAKLFDSGDPDYALDTWWYEMAENHDRIKSGVRPDPGKGDTHDAATDQWLVSQGLGHLADPPDTSTGTGTSSSTAPTPDPAPIPKPLVETKEERFARYRESSVQLPSIAGEVRIGDTRATLRPWLSEWVDLSQDGGKFFAIQLVGGEIELILDRRHPLITEYGWDPGDVALVCASKHLATIYKYDGSIDDFILSALKGHPERKMEYTTVRARADELLDDIRERVRQVANTYPDELWESLLPSAKRAAEKEAMDSGGAIDWPAATRSGEFASYLTAAGVRDIVESHPGRMLDGAVFSAKYAQWGDDIRHDQVERIMVLLGDLGRMRRVSKATDARELNRFTLSADLLADELAEP